MKSIFVPIIYIIKSQLLLLVCLCVCFSESGFELYYNEGSMNAFIVEINLDILAIYKLKD